MVNKYKKESVGCTTDETEQESSKQDHTEGSANEVDIFQHHGVFIQHASEYEWREYLVALVDGDSQRIAELSDKVARQTKTLTTSHNISNGIKASMSSNKDTLKNDLNDKKRKDSENEEKELTSKKPRSNSTYQTSISSVRSPVVFASA